MIPSLWELRLQENTQLLGTAQRKHRNQNLQSSSMPFMNLFQEVPFTAPFGLAYCRRVRRLRDEEVGTALVNPRSPEMAVWRHVVYCVDHPPLHWKVQGYFTQYCVDHPPLHWKVQGYFTQYCVDHPPLHWKVQGYFTQYCVDHPPLHWKVQGYFTQYCVDHPPLH
ncbi:hypothetical protein DPMN_118789 [Dreissena polymorpha]|uniref:Uncharacterized protein n=1 Tax=Dreissena polymorpha TaxID=45954 RepID=A0A9D4GI25_DREPO|nr:hypothetical protein DPMN_118789 [Dreissena polymorpha]